MSSYGLASGQALASNQTVIDPLKLEEQEQRFVDVAIMMFLRRSRVDVVAYHYEPDRVTTKFEVTQYPVSTEANMDMVEAAYERMMEYCAKRLDAIRKARR